tara:strand:+ start:4141 stop:4605 length:465 start_codon:yes stop_codon:yes gene_type:complete
MHNTTDKFPKLLKHSATPRWSHRDPVELGNPFPVGDFRFRKWEIATYEANAALVKQDRIYSQLKSNALSYPKDIVKFAAARFDVWAKRCLSIVCSPCAVQEYELWLNNYVERWLVYASQTCPQVDVQKELKRALQFRVSHWTTQAREVKNYNQC